MLIFLLTKVPNLPPLNWSIESYSYGQVMSVVIRTRKNIIEAVFAVNDATPITNSCNGAEVFIIVNVFCCQFLATPLA